MKNSLFFCFVFVSIVMCKNTAQKSDSSVYKEPAEYPIKIDVEEALSNEETPLLSNFSDEVSYIKLKTPPGIFVKFVRDVQISRDKIYIDALSNVMVFDMEGNFIKQIGRQGRGPDEYIHLRSFFYKGEKEIDFVKGRNSLEELGLVNDMDGGPDFFPKWSVKHDSTQLLISDIKTFNFKKELAQEDFENREIKFPDKKAKLLELVNNLEEKDDYVLMIVKLK